MAKRRTPKQDPKKEPPKAKATPGRKPTAKAKKEATKAPEPARAASRAPKGRKKPPARKRDYTPAPWDMQPKETSNAFEAFTVYREMKYIDRKQGSPTGRSIQRVCDKMGYGFSKVSQMSTRNNWVERCRKYDAYLDKVFGQPEVIEQLEDLHDEQLRACKKMRDLGLKMIENLSEAVDNKGLSPKDYLYVMKHLIRDSVEIEQMITGPEGASSVQVNINNQNGDIEQVPLLIIPSHGRETTNEPR